MRLLLLLIIIYFIFNSPRADDQRPAVVVVFRIDVSIHVLVQSSALSAATLPCWFVSVVVVVAAAASADVVVFIFIIFSRTLSYSGFSSLFFPCTDSSALSLVTFSSPSPRGWLLLFDVSFSLTQSFTFCCCYFCCIIYMSIPTFQLAHYCCSLAGCSIEKIISHQLIPELFTKNVSRHF